MIKSDIWIAEQCVDSVRPMIEPYEHALISKLDNKSVVSYGTSSYGYDIRCAREFKIFTNVNNSLIDPKNFDTTVS